MLPLADDPGFSAWDPQSLAPLPQALAADAQLACQLRLGHVVLVLEDEVLKVVFQRQVFGGVQAGVTAADALLRGQADEVIVMQVVQIDIDAQQLGRNFRAFAQNDGSLYSVFQFANDTGP